jgi:hypothetical protein
MEAITREQPSTSPKQNSRQSLCTAAKTSVPIGKLISSSHQDRIERRGKSIALKIKTETRSIASISSQTSAPHNYHKTMSVGILQQPYELLASGKVMAK